MSEPFVGEIRMFAGSFAPRGWALCDGQLLAIAQNNPLFSLLGTIYGGDGRTTFGLPDLRGRVPLHQGAGPGLSSRQMAQKIGVEQVTMNANELPSHTHAFNAEALLALNLGPDQALLAELPNDNIYATGTPPDTLDGSAIGPSGSGNSHQNVMPFQCVSFLIALTGIYPSRN